MCDDEAVPAYHVFVDGATDRSPAGLEKLAVAIAEHYGLPVTDLRARIASGRFRVKGNCDGATADMYVRDLTRLGARCSIEEATPHNKANTPLPFPAVRPAGATAPPSKSTAPKPSLPPPIGGAPRVTQPPATAGALRSTQPPANYQSGLSAAFSGDSPAASLGALEDGAMLTLGAVDGSDDSAPAANDKAFAPPSDFASASIGPAPEKPAAKPKTKADKPKDEPLDMFAPPDAESAELKVDLAPDEIERSARKRASTPPASVPVVATPEPVATSAAPGRYARQSLQVQNAPVAPRGPSGLANPKTRMVAGVVLSIAIGFIPAHLVASSREKSAYAAIDAKVIATQREAETPDAYAQLDSFRSDQLARKHDDRRNIAIMAMLIWGAVGGAIAYGWFKRIPWDRFQ
jgi:hypothetical protein